MCASCETVLQNVGCVSTFNVFICIGLGVFRYNVYSDSYTVRMPYGVDIMNAYSMVEMIKWCLFISISVYSNMEYINE